jgi:hypothetical protein
MIEQIKEKIFIWFLKRQAKRTIAMPNWDKVRSVAVLYPTDDIQHLIKKIEVSQKDVVLFTMPNKKEICRLTQRPKSEVKELISARHFDVLIDLTQAPSRTMQYMAMYVHADFKVGRHTREGIYDMTIDTPAQETPDYLFEQIIKYINMFSQKN